MNNKMITKYFLDSNENLVSLGLFFLRCTIGIILFMVGAGKVLGWFGGFGMQTTIQYFTKMGISIPLVYISSYTEFLGGFLLIIGLFTRPVTIAVTINMIVATIFMLPKGFIFGMADFPLTLLVIAVVILLTGPKKISIDYLLFRSDN